MTTRDAVLEQLERSRGSCVSGARLAGSLGVSRTAVWKAIEELRADGYEISAVTNRGYCLSEKNDRLSVPAIKACLRCAEAAEHVELYDILDSTNQTAKQRALQGAPDGTVILAENQTGGRGRRGRSFFSPPGCGIYLSMILRTSQAMEKAVMMTTAASVAVARAIEAVTGAQAQIKWINDIYINGRKVCGILTDGVTNLENGMLEYLVLGIGVNVNTKQEDFPEELQERAGSLFSCLGQRVNRSRFAAELIDQLLIIREEYESGAYLEEYRVRSCVLNRRVAVFGNGHEGLEATAVDIDQGGHLVVRTDSGELITLHSGEITIRTI